jgi:hypothetical protein
MSSSSYTECVCLCHGFRLTIQDDYFRVSFDYFRLELAVVKINVILKPKHQELNHVKRVQIY